MTDDDTEDGASSRRPKVFCIGLGKTGTTTFGLLMQEFGYRHLVGPQKLGLQLWKAGRLDWLFELTDRKESFDDFPYPYIYEDLARRYPDARFVLTLRRSAEEWYESLVSHNLRTGPTDTFMMAYDCYSPEASEARLTDHYRRHADGVRAFFAGSENFLELCWADADAGDRFGAFLGRPDPVVVPRGNAASGKDIAATIDKLIGQDRIGAAMRLAEATDGVERHRETFDTVLRARTDGYLRAHILPRPDARPGAASRARRLARALRRRLGSGV